METMNAVPTPRFDVGENVFAAQLLRPNQRIRANTESETYMTSGNRL